MTRNLLSCRKWFLASCLSRSGIWGSVCVLCQTLFLAWRLKIPQHSQQSLKTSKQRSFSKGREKRQNVAFASIVYICVIVFRINQHEGWKVLIFEIQKKMVRYPSSSKWKGGPCLVRTLWNLRLTCFCSFFWKKLKTLKRQFEIIWPLPKDIESSTLPFRFQVNFAS